MLFNRLDDPASGLALNRRMGVCSDLPLPPLRSVVEAEALQRAALDAYDNDLAGYALVGTSDVCQRLLDLQSPIYGPIPVRTLHRGDCSFHLPQGMIGAQSELVFTIGRTFPAGGELVDRASASKAIVACQPAIGLLGRRVRRGLGEDLLAIADFGLHVATICGPLVERIDRESLDRSVMAARIDGKTVMSAKAGAILGHPIDAVVWLAQRLSSHGNRLNAGDIVATGSCAPILQVLPGQHLTVDFTGIGSASCRFD